MCIDFDEPFKNERTMSKDKRWYHFFFEKDSIVWYQKVVAVTVVTKIIFSLF